MLLPSPTPGVTPAPSGTAGCKLEPSPTCTLLIWGREAGPLGISERKKELSWVFRSLVGTHAVGWKKDFGLQMDLLQYRSACWKFLFYFLLCHCYLLTYQNFHCLC